MIHTRPGTMKANITPILKLKSLFEGRSSISIMTDRHKGHVLFRAIHSAKHFV